MKKLILFLLFPALLMAQSRSEIQTEIETIQTGVPNTALKVRNVLSVLADGVAQTGDVKEIDVSNAYLLANFDPTGLGINERVGWAICNGNNGTRDRGGRVSMQYNATYPTLGATGGSADAVVVAHTHTFDATAAGDSGTGTQRPATGTANEAGGNFGISTVGESGVNKNLQPYIITVFIMKLP